MKNYFLITIMLLSTTFTFAQNDAVNLDKYWKFRNDFKEKFIKIGPLPGESLPAGALKPMDCIDNDSDINNSTPYGEMHWGDGMIRHGHYLVLLATEYKLLKNSGKDVTGVLNELYYAIEAVNRLDEDAEPAQAGFYDVTLFEDLNGFFLREDVGEDFAKNNWGTDPMRMACTNSVFYFNNNFAEANEPPGKVVKFNSYQNVPSLDQLSSLMVGFSMIHKLLDNVYVKPTASDDGFYILDETKAIVHRMITYASSHNWFLIDVNGWPVNNGGGDLILMAVPLSIAATRITNQVYPLQTKRRLIKYSDIRSCVTGYGTNAELTSEQQFQVCGELSVQQQIALTNNLSNSGDAGPFNNQTISEFQTWQSGGLTLVEEGFHSASLLAWNDFIPNQEPLANTFLVKLNEFSVDEEWFPYLSYFLGGLSDFSLPDYNETIMFNCGVISQLWEPAQTFLFSTHTGNTQLELIDCVLKDALPIANQASYRAKLDEMPATGPYQLRGQNADENNFYTQTSFAPNGWAAEYRWTHPNESVGNHGGTNGVYSALDYMVFHNLYRLLYANTVSSETNYTCNCSASPTVAPPSGANSYQLEANVNLNAKLAFLPTCPQEVLLPVNHTVSGIFNVQPKFPNYIDLGIFTTKYQRTNATVQSGGEIHMRTRYVQCSNGLTINAGGKMLVEKAETVFGYNTTLDVAGELRVKAGTTLTIRGKLIMRSGSVIEVESGATLFIDAAGSIEYYDGADFYTSGTSSVINIAGRIKAMNATTFKINTTQPSNTSRGTLIINPSTIFEAVSPSTFDLFGKGKEIDFIELRGPTAWVHNNTNVTLLIRDCAVKLMASAGINATKNVQFSYVKFYSNSTNLAVTVRLANSITHCSFTNVPLIGDFSLPGVTNKLTATSCSFLNNGVYQNAENYLVNVLGTGYTIGSSTFTTNTGTRQLKSSALTLPSSVTNCTFTQNATGTNRTTTAIQEVSNIELTVHLSTFNQLATGIVKNYGKLTLKCNTFSNAKTNNLSIANGGLLNMSASDLAGYNTLQAPTSGSSILLAQSNIALANGLNYISDSGTGYCISGTVTTACVPPGCITTVTQNQWNSANTVPSSSKFSILNGQSYIMLVQASPVTAKPPCPIGAPKLGSDKPTDGGSQAKSAYDTDGMPRIYFEPLNDSMRLDDVVNDAISKTTAYDDSLGNDLKAIEAFDQVFRNDLDLADSNSYVYSWLAFDYMKSALENAIGNGLITEAENLSDFETHVGMYVNALMRLTDSIITTDNYLTQFYHEFDKAHLFRVIGHTEIGLTILNELEYCGIDSVQQAQLNYWKTVFETDLVIEQIGEESIDSIITIDTTGFILPSNAINAFSFGARINSLSDISYPNCEFYQNKSKSVKSNGLSVFPNPASDQVTVIFPENLEGVSYLEIQQMDGRNSLSLEVDSSQRKIQLDIKKWSRGTYQVVLRMADGTTKNAKLIVY